MGQKNNMRAYFWGNMYLSSIQQGIQSAHVVAEMFAKYVDNEFLAERDLREWAEHHKTMILYNGGYQSKLMDIADTLKASGKYAWADFREEEASLNGAVTSVGVILPEGIIALADHIRRENETADEACCGYNNDIFLYIGEDGDHKELENVNRYDKAIVDFMVTSRLAS